MASRTIPARTVYVCDSCGVECASAQQVALTVIGLGGLGIPPIPLWRITKDLCLECYTKDVQDLVCKLNALPEE